ncbi:MAG TPA: hypothetical protein VGI20_00615, partial [Rhizomicrobium sp.]
MPLFSHGGWQSSKYAPKGSVHVALVAESCLRCDACTWLIGLAQETYGTLDSEASCGFQQSLPGGAFV